MKGKRNFNLTGRIFSSQCALTSNKPHKTLLFVESGCEINRLTTRNLERLTLPSPDCRSMNYKRCFCSTFSAVAFVSCVFLSGYFLDNSCSFLSVCRLSITSTWQTDIDGILKDKGIKLTVEKNPSRLNSKHQYTSFNVTKLVLNELHKGFFAAIRKNEGRGSSLDNVVCVSEPTVLECQEAGFAALLLTSLDHVSYCHMLGIRKVTIHWKNCQSSCTKDPQTNSWPAFFEPLNWGTELSADKVLCLGGIIVGSVLARESARSLEFLSEQQVKQFKIISRESSLLDVGFRKRQSLSGYEEGAIITSELRKWAYTLITEHFRPQKSILSRVNEFYTNNMRGFSILGVHVRATDSSGENEDHTLPTMEEWIHDAEAVFETLREPKRIFLASDNYEIIVRFGKHFGKNKVVHTSAVRANKYYAKHPINGQFANDTDPIEIGSQVLIDILLLAKCDHFLHRESSVATLASFFNPEMKLFFIGHLGRDVPVDGDLKQKLHLATSESSAVQQGESQIFIWYSKAKESYGTCPNMAMRQLIGPTKKEDSDFKEEPFPDLSEEKEAEWEDGWEEQIQSLAGCFQTNGPHSACPNMAKGRLIDSKEIRSFLAQ